MTTYRVTVTREDGAWFANIAGLVPNLAVIADVLRVSQQRVGQLANAS